MLVYSDATEAEERIPVKLEAFNSDDSCNDLLGVCCCHINQNRTDKQSTDLSTKPFNKPLVYKDLLLSAVFCDVLATKEANSMFVICSIARSPFMALKLFSFWSFRLFLYVLITTQSLKVEPRVYVSPQWSGYRQVCSSGDHSAVSQPFRLFFFSFCKLVHLSIDQSNSFSPSDEHPIVSSVLPL